MAQYEGHYSGQSSTSIKGVSGWVTGFIFFAATMMMIMGFFHFIEGFTAVLDDSFYVVTHNYSLELDVTTWGWIHMIGGVIIGLTGMVLISGLLIARIAAIILAVASAILNFYSIPYYPIWSVLMIALDIGIIWAIVAHGGEYEEQVRGPI